MKVFCVTEGMQCHLVGSYIEGYSGQQKQLDRRQAYHRCIATSVLMPLPGVTMHAECINILQYSQMKIPQVDPGFDT